MNQMKQIVINKNRGWRGLAEVVILDEENKETTKHIFSFSQRVWNDLILDDVIVLKSEQYYYVIHFDEVLKGKLPNPTQQRSVLIKNFTANISKVSRYEVPTWTSATGKDYAYIIHFLKNNNNHTTSDWNCIGIRVVPEI